MDYRMQLEKALVFIESNLNNAISVTDVAKAASYSYYHFHRFFQAMMGETAGSYIRSRRLTQAAKELLYTNKRILDIAVSLQFESHEAFSHDSHTLERYTHCFKAISISGELGWLQAM